MRRIYVICLVFSLLLVGEVYSCSLSVTGEGRYVLENRFLIVGINATCGGGAEALHKHILYVEK